MTEEKQRSSLLLTLLHRNFCIIGLFLLLLGSVIIVLASVVCNAGLLQTVLSTLGVALIPAGTIIIAYEYYMRKEFLNLVSEKLDDALEASDLHKKLDDLRNLISLASDLRPLGLRRIYPGRMEIKFRDMVLSAPPNTEIKILGAALMCVDDWPMQEALKNRLADGCTVKLLSLNPTSQFVKQRAQEEKRDIDDIETDIMRTNDKNENFIKHLPPNLKANIRLLHYEAPPMCFIFATNDLMITSVYLREKRGEFSPHFELEMKHGGICEPFIAHFNSLWESVASQNEQDTHEKIGERANKGIESDE